MEQDMSYTTEEIAKMLKVSKLTVYDLIKKGELPSYKVGKQMRVDAADLDAYKYRSRHAAATQPVVPPASAVQVAPPGSLVITGQDVSLDILANHLSKAMPQLRPLRSYVGSLDSLIALYRGETDLVSTHLLDGDTGEYNLPYIRRLLVNDSYLVVHLLARRAGLYVAHGNPRALHGWADLAQPGLRVVNRERGAGARVLLDEQLRLHGIPRHEVRGYEDEQPNHLAVAARVASGAADVGVGIEKAAAIIGEAITFIPLITERYDLVMRKRPDNAQWREHVLQVLRSDSYRQELAAISGYDLTDTGKILLET
ncbi:helix-turn-helix transcriptional regulator [Paenibacillus daejeonensis]|uniref:helix-turn-helix transcriptional regulator n=1 Tax=Paenibacillus daejeonensis TaxID=135193 RepID=UPI000364987B|nr:helix-turn-helix transcriptional regulator [Paenibacillus daejeonensis]